MKPQTGLTLPDFRRTIRRMAKKSAAGVVPASRCERRWPSARTPRSARQTTAKQKPSALLDTRVVYCGDNLEQLAKLPDACADFIYIDAPFNSNRHENTNA